MTARTRLALAAAITATLSLGAPLAAASPSASAAPEPTPAPLVRTANPVPGQYIVTLDRLVDPAKTAQKLGLKPTFLYSKALNGFAVPLTDLQLTIVRHSLGVKAVEEDAKVSSPASEGVPAPSAPRSPTTLWGLDRIDQRNFPLDDDFTAQGNGAGVTAYILDSGIDYQHVEFGAAPHSGSTRSATAGTARTATVSAYSSDCSARYRYTCPTRWSMRWAPVPACSGPTRGFIGVGTVGRPSGCTR
ncbi:protease inhibitor I9 family protein [Streptomyces sp. Isolate_45]|uniref:protease inhibitor I9 family protein n=1 Tax=Streptomyces sp. Isolate_45 TaxID=2950111 RepID=UPI002481E64A|nr:protease inhibitor I9 family protein [Streptomyces sp. Isolate_45]MDA5280020.1 protease inhibitor I9 family protein [Streptomyces sp. Isolate_45]